MIETHGRIIHTKIQSAFVIFWFAVVLIFFSILFNSFSYASLFIGLLEQTNQNRESIFFSSVLHTPNVYFDADFIYKILKIKKKHTKQQL